jgi:hypothetical protein
LFQHHGISNLSSVGEGLLTKYFDSAVPCWLSKNHQPLPILDPEPTPIVPSYASGLPSTMSSFPPSTQPKPGPQTHEPREPSSSLFTQSTVTKYMRRLNTKPVFPSVTAPQLRTVYSPRVPTSQTPINCASSASTVEVKVAEFCVDCTNKAWFVRTIDAGSRSCCAFPKDGNAAPEG